MPFTLLQLYDQIRLISYICHSLQNLMGLGHNSMRLTVTVTAVCVTAAGTAELRTLQFGTVECCCLGHFKSSF